MITVLTPNTQAILLLTAPLIAGRREPSSDALTPGEYKRLAQFLRDRQRQPADLVGTDAEALLAECGSIIDRERLGTLLDRGFLMSQAVERWHTRAIWVTSRADANYPGILKDRLGIDAPPVLYGCGDTTLLEACGFAVVGSRHANDELLEYAESAGRLTAEAGRTLVSGAARGIDQAAMRGAQAAGGNVVGVLADSLERAALNRDHRDLIVAQRLTLISPYDPAAGFNVGNAMQRNKLIYALAEAALVVSAEYRKGGTWAGAAEQLEKYQFGPVFVRTSGETGEGLSGLQRKGARSWPDPKTVDDFVAALTVKTPRRAGMRDSAQLHFSTTGGSAHEDQLSGKSDPAEERQAEERQAPAASPAASTSAGPALKEARFATVRSRLKHMDTPRTVADVAAELNVSRTQAREWLHRLVEEGILSRSTRPVRFRAIGSPSKQASLFDERK